MWQFLYIWRYWPSTQTSKTRQSQQRLRPIKRFIFHTDKGLLRTRIEIHTNLSPGRVYGAARLYHRGRLENWLLYKWLPSQPVWRQCFVVNTMVGCVVGGDLDHRAVSPAWRVCKPGSPPVSVGQHVHHLRQDRMCVPVYQGSAWDDSITGGSSPQL